jgi:hypothetical protein
MTERSFTIRIVVKTKNYKENQFFDEQELERTSAIYSGTYIRARMREWGYITAIVNLSTLD